MFGGLKIYPGHLYHLISQGIAAFLTMATTLAPSSASTSASASTSTSTSASPHGTYSCEIFINHRGTDVKKTFASHLYRRLLSKGFRVFLDQPELQRGEKIIPQIEEAISTASVHVAIFSPGYAESRWCLDELVQMLKSMESGAATVIPVFYKVKPADLRWTNQGNDNNGGYAQVLRILRWMGIDRVCAPALRILRWTGIDRCFQLDDIGSIYAQALLIHERKGRYSQERLAEWRNALSEASSLSGFELEACNGLVLLFVLP